VFSTGGRTIGDTADAVDTPIGHVPYPAAIDTDGLHVPDADLAAALHVDGEEWAAEIPQINDWFTTFGVLDAYGPER